MPRFVRLTSAAFALSISLAACKGPLSADEKLEFFEAKVRPLLIERCYECHSVESGESSGGLRLDSAAASRAGGSLGPAVVPGDLVASKLVRAVEYADKDMQMPPDGKLADEEIAVLKHWIEIGAPDPREDTAVKTASPLERDPKTHWAFVSPERKRTQFNRSDSRTPLDDWAAQRASEVGLEIAPEASRETLVRRVYFDLTGLPPSRESVDQFVSSTRPDAYTRLVDELLATPEFAERFARHWLDVARYADTVGYTLAGQERRISGSHKFRDWTIQAFASDMPYDEMIRHQLAGDRTDPENASGNLDAMGFLTIGRRYLNGLDTTDDRIDVITRGLLGLTVTCARCHDHKFDPIPTTDYYSLFGVLESSHIPENGKSTLAMVDADNPHDRHVLVRGQQGNHGPIAERQYLTALRTADEPKFTDGSGRMDLVNRITDRNNPLTARVMVNRVWGILIGRPLVDSASDFGFRTEPPKAIEVLDNLAVDFASDWSIKQLVRRIVNTRVYRQSSDASEATITIDADNQYLARANRRRRDFESQRDSMLAKSSVLHFSVGGEPQEIASSALMPRRTLYAMVDRQNLPSIFRTFDFASPDAHSPGRYFTTVPQQSLYLLNSDHVHEMARQAAEKVKRETGDDVAAMNAMFPQILSREPSVDEAKQVEEFLKKPLSQTETLADPSSLWSYLIATISGDNKITATETFPHFKDGRWQVEAKFPSDGPKGYAYFSADTGHAPSQIDLGVSRRWTAPTKGTVSIFGEIKHANDKGDGIRAMVFINGELKWDEKQKATNRPFGPLDYWVEAGQTIDLIVMPGENANSDSFYWISRLSLKTPSGLTIDADSEKDFSGPNKSTTIRPLDRLEQLAQVLLMSNEFAFVD